MKPSSIPQRPARGLPLAALAAAAAFAAAVAGFGALLPGYLQSVHPVALLGADGIARATAFNACAFVVPGLLNAWTAWHVRTDAAPRWRARIGCQLLLLSALAFAAQGLLPLDPADIDGPASRLHAAAWMAWLLAFASGAMLLAAGRALRGGVAVQAVVLVLAVLVPLAALLAPSWLPAAIAQRIAFAGWLAWMVLARVAIVPTRG